jgi:hypothetical protein
LLSFPPFSGLSLSLSFCRASVILRHFPPPRFLALLFTSHNPPRVRILAHAHLAVWKRLAHILGAPTHTPISPAYRTWAFLVLFSCRLCCARVVSPILFPFVYQVLLVKDIPDFLLLCCVTIPPSFFDIVSLFYLFLRGSSPFHYPVPHADSVPSSFV